MGKAELYGMDEAEAVYLLAGAAVVRLAAIGEDGAPILRALRGTAVEGAITFEAGRERIGSPAVVAAEELIAGTTFHRSVQVHGVIERVDERTRRVPFTRIVGEAELGQGLASGQLDVIVADLWERGLPGDPRAIELVRAANPGAVTPAFLEAPEGARLHVALGPADVPEVVAMLEDAYWNGGVTAETIRRSHLGATAWVGARDDNGRLVATARALADGAKFAWVYDVMVAPEWRGRGLGEAVMRLLLDHPAVRRARQVWLATRDAMPFYGRLGFVPRADVPPRPFPVTEMALLRDTLRA